MRVREPLPFIAVEVVPSRKHGAGNSALDDLFSKELLEDDELEVISTGSKPKKPVEVLQEFEKQRQLQNDREKKRVAIAKGIAEEKLKVGLAVEGSLAELGPINGRVLEPLNAVVGELDRLDRYDRDHLKYENRQVDLQAQR